MDASKTEKKVDTPKTEKKVPTSDKVKVQSSEGKTIEISKEAANLINALKNAEGNKPVALDVSNSVLAKIVEYCNYHAAHADEFKDIGNSNDVNDVAGWDKKFLDSLDLNTLFEVTAAASNLGIGSLEVASTKSIAAKMQGKSADAIRKTFQLTNDFSAEDEEKSKKEFAWFQE